MSTASRAPLLLLSLGLLVLWRLLAAWHGNIELYADEAQYWTWALQPDWGYFSKPPMVAWAIWLSRTLFGDAEIGVRAISLLLYPVTAWVLFLLVRRLFKTHPQREDMAFWSALTFATLPLVSLGSWLITTDAVLLLFWSLSLYFTVAALESGRWRDWLLLGCALGAGFMSKYSMVFYGLGFLAWLLLMPRQRKLLRDPRPYAAAAVALLLLAPNLIWNARHDFVSVQHTAEISQLDRGLFHPGAMLEFVLGQFLVFGPLLFAGLMLLVLRPRTWLDDERLRLLAAFTLAPLAAFMALSLLSRAFANWAAFAYVGGAALIAAVWVAQGHRRWLIAALALHLAMAAAMYHAHDITRALDIQLTRKTDPYGRVTGYRELGREVALRLQIHPEARLLSNDRKLHALLRYYARPGSEGMRYLNPNGTRDNHYALSADLRDSPKGEFLLVSQGVEARQLAAWFAQVTPQAPIRLNLYPDYQPEYQVWLLRDYRQVAPACPQGVGRGCNAAQTPAATTTLSLPAPSSHPKDAGRDAGATNPPRSPG
ncbi:MAG: glycosyltransferase family 39 protein [Pseudomonadota bacterium]|nr:glycosyltransferase family 39 protein [Pseudomonadota bacterium]